jgi:mannosyltransferase
LMQRMDRIIACSSGGASFLDRPYQMIPHGVDTDFFVPAIGGKPVRKSELGFAVNRKLIGCFGRVRHQKGTDLLVDALIEILPHTPAWDAIICGRVTAEHMTFKAELDSKIAKAGLGDRIRFMGEVPDVLPYLQAIDLAVAPSRNEGFGLTPLEAMACGAPVVASDAGAYRDMIRLGMNGTIVPAGDKAALTKAISQLLDMDANLDTMGMAARAFVVEHFAITKEVNALNSLYETVAIAQTKPR